MTIDVGAKVYIILALFIFIIPLVTTFPVVMILASQVAKPVIIGLLTLLSLVYIGLALVVGTNEIQNTDGALEFKAGFYSYTLSRSELENAEVIHTNRNELGEQAVKIRTNGIGLFGYNVGWFRLKNGADAFVMFVGNNEDVTLIKSKRNVILVNRDLSPLL